MGRIRNYRLHRSLPWKRSNYLLRHSYPDTYCSLLTAHSVVRVLATVLGCQHPKWPRGLEMTDQDWTKPAAMAIPKEGYFELERGRYGPTYPRTPACHGFSIIAKVKEGREEAVRAYGKQIEEAIAGSPDVLAPLRLHYLRWVLFDVGSGLHFQYQGIFDTDFDKYTEDAVALFSATGITTVFTNLEGFPEDWKENPDAFVKFVREHHYPSFLEYGEYPFVTADEIKKALRLKAAFSTMLDQMQ